MTSQDSDRRRLCTRVGAVLWITAALGYFLLEAIAAAAVVPTYSYSNNFISDLGLPARSPRADVMNTAFYVQAILFFAGALLVALGLQARNAVVFLGFAATNAVGNILVGTVHSAPATGGGQIWHSLGAVLAIMGGNAAILAGSSVIRCAGGSRAYRAVSVALGALGLLCLVGLGLDTSHTVLPIGIWERASVYSILIWQVYTAMYLIFRPTAGK